MKNIKKFYLNKKKSDLYLKKFVVYLKTHKKLVKNFGILKLGTNEN